MRRRFTSLGILSMFLMGSLAYAQVKGVLKDSNGFPMDEVEVIVTRTGASVFTDVEGNFNVDAKVGDILKIIDSNGEEKTIKVTSTTLGDVKFITKASSSIELNTVTLVGGIKMDAAQKIGAYDIVKKEDFELAPTASIDEVLNGRVSGLVFSTNSGDPGSTNIITIRGVGSLIGTPNPLYVIDGIVVGKGSDNAGLMESWNPLAAIDPNMIESVAVLKDASATALYGARGANGVIVVTTKRGKYNQKTRFNIGTDMAFQSIAYDKQEWMSASEYIKWGGLMEYNSGSFTSMDDAVKAFSTLVSYDGVTDENWQKRVQRNTASVKTYNFAMTGGGESTSYRFGASYYENNPLILNSYFDRMSLSTAIDHKIEDKFTFGLNVNYTNVKRNSIDDGGAYRNPWLTNWYISPIYPAYNADGTYNQDNLGPSNSNFNPLAIQEMDFTKGRIETFLGSVNGEWQFAKDFYLYSLFGAQSQKLEEKMYWDPRIADGLTYGGVVQQSFTNIFDWNWQNSVSFRKKVNDRHDIQAYVGMEYQEHNYTISSASVGKLSEPRPFLTYGTERRSADEDVLKWTQISYFSRLNYILDGKYTFSAQLRRDSNSTLGKFKKSGVFWSVGGSWNVTKDWDSSPFSKLILRANYGEIGNIPYADSWGSVYNSLNLLGISSYTGDDATIYLSNAKNDNLAWEVSKQFNVGLDFGFIKDKLTLSVDAYQRKTASAIYTTPIAPQNGSPGSFLTNIGEITNRGVELSFNYLPVNGEHFRWNIYGNASYNKNKVTKLANPDQIDRSSLRALSVGKEYLQYYTYEWAGVDEATGYGTIWKDESRTEKVILDNASKYSQASRIWQKDSPFPKYLASLKNDFTYKGFTLSVFFTGQFKFSVMNRWQNYVTSDGNSIYYNQTKDVLYNSWTETNTKADNPKQMLFNTTGSYEPSTRWLRKGDHIRLKDIKFAYSFNDLFKKSTGIDNFTIYAKGTNLWIYVFDKDLTFDPESNSNAAGGAYGKGMYDYTSPIMKSVSLGISIDF